MIGFVVMLGGISNLLGSLLAPRVLLTFSLGQVLIGTAVLPGIAACLIPLAPGSSWIWGAAFLGASQLLGDVAFPIFGIHELTLRQSIAPPALLGRVNAGIQMLQKGMLPLGALLAGLLAQIIGTRGHPRTGRGRDPAFIALAGLLSDPPSPRASGCHSSRLIIWS